MPLKLKTYKGRPYYYLRGTVKANRKRVRIYETTGIRIGTPGAKARAQELLIRRQSELLEELTSGKPARDLSWTEVAMLYCKARALSRISKRPELEGTIDPEAGYVLRLTNFLIRRKAAGRPIGDLRLEDIQAYFNNHLRGKELSYLHRCRNNYLAVMNWAVAEEYCGADFPMPELPNYDPRKIPVNKNLPRSVIDLFIKFAPQHAKLLFETIFDTGLRGGELLFLNRTEPDDDDPRRSGLSLEEGSEFLHLGVTKDGKAITRSISGRLARRMEQALKARKDGHDALFLTDKGVPYKRARVQRGSQFRSAWNSTRRKVIYELTLDLEAAKRRGNDVRIRELVNWIKMAKRATGHWGRHSMISRAVLAGMSDRQIMAVSGHRSPQMIARYSHLGQSESKELAETVSLDGMPSAPVASRKNPVKTAARKHVGK
ncbi:tyrosine-type recombinase/integrase [Dongia sp.]|uniref:tyrosine-type recombinase/integrase n=1 Tax=Dongia sp. TaxID=1977262 RepID=UPI003751B495